MNVFFAKLSAGSYKLIGYFFTFLAIIFTIPTLVLFFQGELGFGWFLFLLILWIFLFLGGRALIKFGRRCRIYIDAIYKDNARHINDLTERVNCSYNQVYQDLVKLIERKILRDVVLDPISGSFYVLGEPNPPATGEPEEEYEETEDIEAEAAPTAEPRRSPRCKSCGAMNAAHATECEYCGSAL